MSMATLRSRLSFARRLPSLAPLVIFPRQFVEPERLYGCYGEALGGPPGDGAECSAGQNPAGFRSTAWSRGDAPPKSGPSVSFGAPPEERMFILASEGERSADEADVLAEQRPSAVAAPSEADAELSAMLLRAAEGLGLEVPKVPPPDPSRLDDWFLRTRSAALPHSPPLPFFPEVHDELVRAWRAPYSACLRSASSALATLDGRAAKGYAGVPQVERAVAVHLCPQDAATWRGSPRLLSKACRLSSALTGRAYCAAGQAATTLHAMATLQVYQAKALKQLHKGSPAQEVMQELRAATDFALRATKVTALSLGQMMSMLVVQEHHLWLNLPQMADVDKAVPPLPEEDRDLLCVQPPSTYGSARRYASSGSDSEPTLASAGTWEEGCPTAVTSVNAPLIPLAAKLGAWLKLPSLSRWLIRMIQYARRPPKFRGVLFTSVRSDTDASVLRAENAVLLAKDAIEPVPPAEMKSGFYSPYFIVPRKSGGLQPILDLRVLNRSLLRLPFKMLTSKRILSCIRHQDWFAAIDLKNAYFHVSILPQHRPFLRFAFEGRAYQYKVLPFGVSLSPRVFTKVTEGALTPLWRKGVRILNYLDDWLIIAHSRDLLCKHRNLVLRHLSHLGLRVNREKSKLSPVQRISFLGMELDSVNMTACLTNERTQSVLNCLKLFRHKTAVPLKTFQRLLGYISATAACRRLFSPWSDPAFLRAGVPLGQVSRHVVVHTDTSTTGWGAVCNGQAASGSWMGPRLLWHINCLELLAVLLALRRFLPMLRHKHVLVRTDNTATVAYINHQGGLCSRRMSQLARHLLLWSQTRLKSLRAVHIPGELNRAADQPSRQPTHPGEWRPQTVQLILSRFGEAQIDLFASPESFHCQLYYSLSEAPLGSDALAHRWPPGPNYAFPPVSLLAQTLCKIREDGEQVLLVAPYWPTLTWFVDLTLLATAPPWKIPLRKDLLSQRMGTIWHPHPNLWNLHVWLLDGTR
ncbi:Transposon Ty3-I Gag-Pol polyprotein [Labeo rohita]|uniref:ribonuclease H n=1 Tax=Labeo rohita TaxID=84645 RepID=A0ABQ8L5F3_LABRO|nr:Transposon Ty3-I Gag-Pol polyprotein [Labeo rohita]